MEIVGRVIILKRAMNKRSKEFIPKLKKLGVITIVLQGAIQKTPILLSQYGNNGKFNSTL